MPRSQKAEMLALEIQKLYSNLPKVVTSSDWYALLTIAQKGLQLAILVKESES